jgi:hypothetical protein
MYVSGELNGNGRGRAGPRLCDVARVVRVYIFKIFLKMLDSGVGSNWRNRFQTDFEQVEIRVLAFKDSSSDGSSMMQIKLCLRIF